jgi:hypothetical protein|tara:strand:+ start:939 stop:1079 length:141 start_codon:yes stop_codon:yes gene_type:complete
MKRFYVTLILEVADQSEEDLEYNAQQYIKDDIYDNCLYIHEIKEIK